MEKEGADKMADMLPNDNSPIKPTITMTVDPPNDEPPNQIDNCEEEERIDKEIKICSPTNLFKTSQNTNMLAKSILKPSQLIVNSSPTSSKFVLKQSSLSSLCKPPEVKKTDTQGNSKLKFVPLQINSKTDSQKAPLLETKNINNVNDTNKVSVAAPSFVFGQNLQERVITADAIEVFQSEENLNEKISSSACDDDMLFRSVVKPDIIKTVTVKEKESKTLSESAKEYEESRANKRKYVEVEIVTGEEKDTNILNISCKLFSFDNVLSNWLERGRGILRLNDYQGEDSQIGSRLVFRTAGSLRVVLNTKVWAEMTVDKANEKSTRLTALDSNGEIKIFLIMANTEDSKQLFAQLRKRVDREIESQKKKKIKNT